MEIPGKSIIRVQPGGLPVSARPPKLLDGKAAKDRITMLAESLKAPLQNHLRTVQELLGHSDVTTMIYTHVLNRGRPEFAAQLMDYAGAIAEVSMTIRIRRHDKSLYGMEAD